MHDIELARGWRIAQVRACLANQKSSFDLIDFIRARYSERFFGPIHLLTESKATEHRHGFAVMALCCLLVETIESYREGIPSTNRGELRRIEDAVKQGDLSVPAEYSVRQDEWPKNAEQPFVDFFGFARDFFGELDGSEFYKFIRNGLLHQAQTKNRWLLVRTGQLWDKNAHRVNRDLFARKLEECFNSYLTQLKSAGWDDDPWCKARRKVWWLATLSERSF